MGVLNLLTGYIDTFPENKLQGLYPYEHANILVSLSVQEERGLRAEALPLRVEEENPNHIIGMELVHLLTTGEQGLLMMV